MVNTFYPLPRESDRVARVDRTASANPRNWISIHVMPGNRLEEMDRDAGGFFGAFIWTVARDNHYSVRSERRLHDRKSIVDLDRAADEKMRTGILPIDTLTRNWKLLFKKYLVVSANLFLIHIILKFIKYIFFYKYYNTNISILYFF